MTCRSCTYLPIPALDRWHCIHCGQRFPRANGRRKFRWWCLAVLLVILAAAEWGPAYLNAWADMAADIGRAGQ